MPARRKLPDAATLRSLRAHDKTIDEIAAMYGVTGAGVWRALERAGMTAPTPNYRTLLPWKVREEHSSTAVMDHFRSLVRRKFGLEVSDYDARLLNDWLEFLEENRLVVAYDHNYPPNAASRKGGFHYVPAAPEDQWIVRVPEGATLPEAAVTDTVRPIKRGKDAKRAVPKRQLKKLDWTPESV